MAQADYVVANGTGAAVRSDLNGQLAAIVSNSSGATEPATMYAYQWWANTTTGLLLIRNAANSAWVTVGTLADANLGLLSLAGGTLTGALLVDNSGTAALPAIAFDGDPDSGLFSPGADQVAVSTGGTGRLFVDSAGNVGIGTASPGSALQVEGLITGTAVVSSGTDTTAGRLLTTAAGPAQAFRRGNILGAVSESSGVPTGAIIEEGSNANGDFTKYADGTVIMSMRRTESRSASGTLTTNVTLPLTLSEDVATGRGSVTATVNSATPQNATSISVNDTDSTTDIDVRINRSNSTSTNFYVILVGRWF